MDDDQQCSLLISRWSLPNYSAQHSGQSHLHSLPTPTSCYLENSTAFCHERACKIYVAIPCLLEELGDSEAGIPALPPVPNGYQVQ